MLVVLTVGACRDENAGLEAVAASSGIPCGFDGDCPPGVRCELIGLSGICSDREPTGPVFFEGVECEDDEGSAPFQVFFDIPRPGRITTEFYRLPFPNDIRLRADGRIDLNGFPRPPRSGPIGVVTALLDQLSADTYGYGPHQHVYFRSTKFISGASLSVTGDDAAVYLVDVTPDAPSYGRRLSLSFFGGTPPGRFICGNWFIVHPTWRGGFEPGHTYAAVLTADIRSLDGDPPVVADDLLAMMADRPPDEPELARAWSAYAPFRTYMADEGLSAGDIAGATVFTIGHPTDVVGSLRAAVAPMPPPRLKDLVECDEGTLSPCDDGLTGAEHVRGCFSADADFYELHTRVDVPIFQRGTAPYLNEDGEVALDATSAPLQQGTASVCAAITLPKSVDMPAGGYPAVVFAHDTQGSFRSHIPRYGADLSALGFVTIGFDGVLHGERRGASEADPVTLTYSHINPRGLLGALLQSVVDVMVVGRYAAGLRIPAPASPTASAVEVDADRIVFFGHGQGAVAGVPAIAVDDVYSAAVLSDAYGGRVLSMVEQTSPIHVQTALATVLREGRPWERHAVLSLLQLYLEPVDPLNYARRVLLRPPAGQPPVHVLMTWGQDSPFTPERASISLAERMGLNGLAPLLGSSHLVPEIAPPVTGNVRRDGNDITAGLAQYAPSPGGDAHTVAFDVLAARRQILGFIGSFATDGVPTIPRP